MMQDIFGSVRRSLVFRSSIEGEDGNGGAGAGVVGGGGARLAEKIGSCLRKSRGGLGLGLGFLPKQLSPPPRPDLPPKVISPAIRWRKGELIGCGAFGRVYMGMNLDSGELLAVKQVLIGTNNASKERAQAHIRELEEEVKLLRNLSHPNIVRYLGTAREEDTLNILMEFVPGGSISSLLGKFGSFPEAVIRMYTKQLLQGLDYLHQNGIIHRDIKGANILVDNKGCIKLADFGASKQVAKLATTMAAKSMKGTPYWMAPEVILQTGHSFSADIWSVGCTVIEMATGKPPWSQQFQEVAALFHIGTTKSHPPIPEHLSPHAKDFLLKCLQKEPSSRPTSSDLLQHPFVTGENQDTHQIDRASVMESSGNVLQDSESSLRNPLSSMVRADDFDIRSPEKLFNTRPIWETSCNSDDVGELGDKDDLPNVGSSYNPISEPFDDWPCKFDISPQQRRDVSEEGYEGMFNEIPSSSEKVGTDFTFPFVPLCDDEEEVTETKIRAFLDEKALDLKKMQTPLYEFYNTWNASNSLGVVTVTSEESATNNSKLPPKCKSSPSKGLTGLSPTKVDTSSSPGNCSRRMSTANYGESNQILREIPSPKLNELGHLQDSQSEQISPSQSFSERRRKWKEELAQELEREREMRQAGVGGRMLSPKERSVGQKRDRMRFASPAH